MDGQGSDADGGGGNEVVATPPKSAGKKRKGGASDAYGNASAVKKARVNSAREKAKKVRTEMENGDGEEDEDPLAGADQTPVKTEKHAVGDGDDGDGWLV